VLLAVDVGNTNTVLGVFRAQTLVESWRVKTDGRATSDELALLYRGLTGAHEVTGLAACSTVPAVLHELRAMTARHFPDLPAVFVEPGTRTGVPLHYDNPREVGADRIVNTLAAYTVYGGPAIVVDFGTSTNFDVVGAKGEFLGGVLAPGIEISIDALAARGARLFKVELARPRAVVGKTTVEALQSGMVYGFAAQVDGLVRRIVAEVGPVRHVVATGGLARVVLDQCETVTAHDPDLTLTGLRLVYEKNARG